MIHRILIALIVLVIVGLQVKLWFGDGSVRTIIGLRQAVGTQESENDQLKKRNDQLAAEVKNLKEGTDAIEERARNDLGMIGRNETFFQVADMPEAKAKTQSLSPADNQPTETASGTGQSTEARLNSPVKSKTEHRTDVISDKKPDATTANDGQHPKAATAHL